MKSIGLLLISYAQTFLNRDLKVELVILGRVRFTCPIYMQNLGRVGNNV